MLNWIASLFLPSSYQQQLLALQDTLDDDVEEVARLQHTQQRGDFANMSRAQLVLLAQQQAELLQSLNANDALMAEPPKHLAEPHFTALRNHEQASTGAHRDTQSIKSAKRVIKQLTEQLDQSNSERERALRRFGREKAALEMRLLALRENKLR